jgi:hypothetical protein
LELQNLIHEKSNSKTKIIFWTTLLAGTLDILAAFIQSILRAAANPVKVLQFIASPILGEEAFYMGLISAMFGLFTHYTIACIWTSLFFLVYPKIQFSGRYKIFVGLGYGIIIWLIMTQVVLPLANVPQLSFTFLRAAIASGILMLFVGLPISLMYYRYNN